MTTTVTKKQTPPHGRSLKKKLFFVDFFLRVTKDGVLCAWLLPLAGGVRQLLELRRVLRGQSVSLGKAGCLCRQRPGGRSRVSPAKVGTFFCVCSGLDVTRHKCISGLGWGGGVANGVLRDKRA